mgnify:CR=1 FL=1
MNNNSRTGKIIGTICIWIVVILCIVPFIWMVSASFKREADIFATPFRLIPNYLNFDNFKEIVNLNEMLVQMTDIYIKSLDNNIFINPYAFGLKLTQVGNSKYSAVLVLQEETVLNWKIEPYERKKYKKNLFFFVILH